MEDREFVYYCMQTFHGKRAYDLYSCPVCHDTIAMNLSDEWRDAVGRRAEPKHEIGW